MVDETPSHIIKRTPKIGQPAGSPIYVGRHQGDPSRAHITVIEYNGSHFEEREVAHPSEILPLKPAPIVTWINVDAVHDTPLLTEFGEAFKLHPLLLEDILNTDQRPKCDIMDDTLYVILKMFEFDAVAQKVLTEQVSIVIGRNYVITFQEDVGNEFDALRERLRASHMRIRSHDAGYLAYSLIDTVVDHYFLALEQVGECLENLEDKITVRPRPRILQKLHHFRRELIFLRKHIWPVREVVSTLQRNDAGLLSDQTLTYLRDVHDHAIQVMDTLEAYRDLLVSIQDLYHSVNSNRMNEIMKVLTIISTIFIPLTFIVGVYGMNFKYMPELQSPWGYPTVWAVMLLVAIGMLSYFKRQKWF